MCSYHPTTQAQEWDNTVWIDFKFGEVKLEAAEKKGARQNNMLSHLFAMDFSHS